MSGTLNANYVQPDVGTNLYLNSTSGQGNVVVGNGTTSLVTFTSTGNVSVTGTHTAANSVTTGTHTANNLTVTGTPTFTNTISAPNTFGFKNRVINGSMTIDQRNAGTVINPAVNGNYCVDRWTTRTSQSTYYKIQQNAGSVTPPPGFSNYLGVTSLNSSSLGSSDYAFIAQYIEGLNCQDLNWGTANAKTVTLSFWVQSSLTGTFGGAIRNYQNSSYGCYVFSYSIPVANTWTYISVTIPGPTSGGASQWLATNTGYMEIDFSFGVGSTYSGSTGSWLLSNNISPTGAVSVIGTANATFYLTGVQLEVGTQATAFDYRPYGTELQLCQRYFINYGGEASGGNGYQRFALGFVVNSTTFDGTIVLSQPMRTTPSVTTSSGSLAVYTVAGNSPISNVGFSDAGYQSVAFRMTTSSVSMTTGQGGMVIGNSSLTAAFQFGAEL